MVAVALPAEDLPVAVKRSGENHLPAVIQPGTLSHSRASHPAAVRILQTENKKKHQINAKIICLKYNMAFCCEQLKHVTDHPAGNEKKGNFEKQ